MKERVWVLMINTFICNSKMLEYVSKAVESHRKL